jgi:hypothetical protein
MYINIHIYVYIHIHVNTSIHIYIYRQDNWLIQCTANIFTALATNVYGYEFRFGVEKTLGIYMCIFV